MSNNVLDLSCFIDRTMEIKMPDGQKLNISKPTQRVMIAVMALQGTDRENPEDVVKAINDVALSIINNNKQGIVYRMQDVANMPLDAQSALIKAYGNFARELTEIPN